MNDALTLTARSDKAACPDCGGTGRVAPSSLDRRACRTCYPPKPRPVELRCPDCRDTGQKYPGMGLSMPASELPCETCWGLPSGTPEQIAANREAILAARVESWAS